MKNTGILRLEMTLKTHDDMMREKAWQSCQAGHTKHDRKVVDTEIGKMTIYDYEQYMGFNGYCSGQDDISRTLDLYGRWEVDETAVAREVLEAGNRNNLFIDVGSHVGWFSRLAQQYGYQVHAYEADLENIELFTTNTEGIAVVNHIWFGEDSKIAPPFERDIELLKIDIEGAEKHAIRVFKDSLPRVKNILIEVSPCFNDSYPQLIGLLQDLGFSAYFMDGQPFDNKYDFDQTNLLLKRGK